MITMTVIGGLEGYQRIDISGGVTIAGTVLFVILAMGLVQTYDLLRVWRLLGYISECFYVDMRIVFFAITCPYPINTAIWRQAII